MDVYVKINPTPIIDCIFLCFFFLCCILLSGRGLRQGLFYLMCMCVYTRGGQKLKFFLNHFSITYIFSFSFFFFFDEISHGTWSSPTVLDWVATNRRNVSVSASSVLGLQVHATILGFQGYREPKLMFSCFHGQHFIN